MRELSLPTWAKELGKGKIEIQAAEFYPEILAELAVGEDGGETFNPEEPDQFWLEIAFNCAKLDIRSAVMGTEYQPELGGALAIYVTDATKDEGGSKWAQSKWPEGKGALAATQGREIKNNYSRIRGGLV